MWIKIGYASIERLTDHGMNTFEVIETLIRRDGTDN